MSTKREAAVRLASAVRAAIQPLNMNAVVLPSGGHHRALEGALFAFDSAPDDEDADELDPIDEAALIEEQYILDQATTRPGVMVDDDAWMRWYQRAATVILLERISAALAASVKERK